MDKDTIMERVALWTARFEDSSLLRETMEENEVDAFLLDEAYTLMCDLWSKHVNGEIRWNVPNPGGSRNPIADALKDLT